MARPVTHPRLGPQQVVASGINMSGVSRDIRWATRDAGADTDEVLRGAGYSEDEIKRLRGKGVI